jgi:hypothetical protein
MFVFRLLVLHLLDVYTDDMKSSTNESVDAGFGPEEFTTAVIFGDE